MPFIALARSGGALEASAEGWFITPMLEGAWKQESCEIQPRIDYANYLLGIHCDAAFNAAVQHRFWQIDQESLAIYNRGYISAPVADTNVPVPISRNDPSPDAPLAQKPTRSTGPRAVK